MGLACVAGAWKWWEQEKTRAREGDTRVSLARARSLFRPLLPSACYAGYYGIDHWMPAKFMGRLTAKLVGRLTAILVDRLTAKLVNHLTAKLVVVNLVKIHLTKFNQLPHLSGRWVPGIPRGFHSGQPAPR